LRRSQIEEPLLRTLLSALAVVTFANTAYAVVATGIEAQDEEHASMCRYIATYALFNDSHSLAHDVRLVSEIFANDPRDSVASADGWLAGIIASQRIKDASDERQELDACMDELIKQLVSYRLNSCGFEVTDLRKAWSAEEQREVDQVLEQYGQYGLGIGDDDLEWLLAAIAK
jgi:hypothetical protein